MANKRISIIIAAKDMASSIFGKVKAGLSSLRGAASKILSPIGLITGGAGAFGLGLMGKGFLDTASSFEDLELSLSTTLGTMEKAKKAIAFANKEAAASPFTVMEYAQAIRTLSAYGVDYTKTMTTLGNTAAAMGKPLQMAVEALSDALQGEGERLKEFGIKQRTEGDNLVYTWVDKLGKVRETIAKNNPEIIQQVLLGIWNEKYKGGMAKFADAWSGLTSTAKSLWDDFKLSLMNSGPFQSLKVVLKSLIDEVNRLKAGGQFDKIAANFGGKIVEGIKKGLEFLPTFGLSLLKAAEMLVLAFSGWKQIQAAVDIVLIKLRMWGLEFIEGLRHTFIVMLEGLDNIPGVDTSQAQTRALYDSASTQWRIGDATKELNEAERVLGKIQLEQDKTTEKFKEVGRTVDQYLTKFASDAWLKVDAAQKLAAASAGGVADATKESARQTTNDLGKVESAAGSVEKALKKAGKAAKEIGNGGEDGDDKAESEIERLLRRWEELNKIQADYRAKHQTLSFSPDGNTTGGRTDFRGSNKGGEDMFDAGDLEKQAEALNTVADSQKVAAENAERHGKAIQLSSEYMAVWREAAEKGSDTEAMIKSYDALANSFARVANMSDLAAKNILKLSEAQALNPGSGINKNDNQISIIENALKLAERTGG